MLSTEKARPPTRFEGATVANGCKGAAMSSLWQHSQMSEATARLLIHVFARTYRINTAGEFVNKVGEPAPQRSIDLVMEAQGVLADAS